MMKSLATVAAVLLAPALAAAQPAPTMVLVPVEDAPAPQPQPAMQPQVQQAPQNAAWQDLSHINGQLVPVGTKNEYFTAPLRKTNISVNPVGALFGFYGASASYAVSNNVAIRGDFEIFDVSDLKGTEFDLTAPIYLRKTYTGLFIEPGVMVRSFQKTDYDCYDCSSTVMATSMETSFGPEVMVGYHYMTDSGFNMAAAFGVMRNLNKPANTDEYSSDDIDIQPAGYFRVGYAF